MKVVKLLMHFIQTDNMFLINTLDAILLGLLLDDINFDVVLVLNKIFVMYNIGMLKNSARKFVKNINSLLYRVVTFKDLVVQNVIVITGIQLEQMEQL